MQKEILVHADWLNPDRTTVKRSRSNVSPSDTFRNLFHPRRAIRSAMRHLHRLRLRHWRVQKGLLPQAQILFRFPQRVLLVCFPVIRPFPHRPINRIPLRTGTIQPPQLLRSTGFKLVASCKQVERKLHQPLCYSGRFFFILSHPLFIPLPFSPLFSVSRSFFLIPHTTLLFSYPPLWFKGLSYPPYPLYYILYIYILLLSILLTSPTKAYIFTFFPFDSMYCFAWGGIVYPFFSLHFLLPSFSVLFDVRIE